jgi:ribosomal protein S19
MINLWSDICFLRDGCKRSGVFVALSLVLEKIEIDDEVDIFQVVRTIQIRRQEFFPNFVSLSISTYFGIVKHI